ncbi:hypothetical protein CCP3SC1_820008 [Gammaproteobacteria bacterium]
MGAIDFLKNRYDVSFDALVDSVPDVLRLSPMWCGGSFIDRVLRLIGSMDQDF